MDKIDINKPRVPPHSMVAEQGVLGAILLKNECFDTASELITDKDFYARKHQVLFRAMGDLMAIEEPVDVLTLSDWLNQLGQLPQVGGIEYLGALAKDTPSTANIGAYTRIISEKATLRKALISADSIINAIYDQSEIIPARDLIDKFQSEVLNLNDGKRTSGPVFIGDILSPLLVALDERFLNEESITGLPTGFTALDDELDGLHPTDLIIVGGRPSMGKTAFVTNIAEYVALEVKKPVFFINLEMSGIQLAERAISGLSVIPLQKIRKANFGDDKWPKITEATAALKDAPLIIDETPELNVAQIRSRCRQMKRQHDIQLVIVDYLQLIQCGGLSSANSRNDMLSDITRNLKGLARELDVPVICLSQLNRSLETRTNKRPVMSDLRESGSIEQDADIIMFVYRDEVYNPDTTWRGTAEILIAKNRNGPTEAVRLATQLWRTRFLNYVPERDNIMEISSDSENSYETAGIDE